MDVLPGTTEAGTDTLDDVLENERLAAFLSALRDRQEALWAVVSQGRLAVDFEWVENSTGSFLAVNRCAIYIPDRYSDWWAANSHACYRTLHAAARSVWTARWAADKYFDDNLVVEFILHAPDDLVDFIAQNTARPKPRRYNSTAVQYYERDGVAWLTAPEVKLYDALKETSWLFIPQPQFLASELIDSRPDFLIFWKNRAQNAVLVEVDSDRFHSAPSQRERDEAKERRFASRGFDYLRFSAKRVLDDPFDVVKEITAYCERKFGRQ